jgi:hypothetical protein
MTYRQTFCDERYGGGITGLCHDIELGFTCHTSKVLVRDREGVGAQLFHDHPWQVELSVLESESLANGLITFWLDEAPLNIEQKAFSVCNLWPELNLMINTRLDGFIRTNESN